MTYTAPSAPDEAPGGQGKALAAGAVTFAAVLIAVLLEAHYAALFDQLKNNGYPMPVIIAGVAAILSHLITWWTSASLIHIVIGWIKGWKQILKELNSPTE